MGASGGLIILWNSAFFKGDLLEIHRSAIRVKFTSVHNAESWELVNVYGPCSGAERDNFVTWLYNLIIPCSDNWLILGDFNFIRSVENRNKPGANMNDIFLFNDIISHLGLQEIPVKGRAYTWSNMQDNPLLEQLDWFFTSPAWTLKYPNTMVNPMAKPTSDHIPLLVRISTKIPKARVFRFENFWVKRPGFMDLVASVWNKPVRATTSVGVMSSMLKALRYELKKVGEGFVSYQGLDRKM